MTTKLFLLLLLAGMLSFAYVSGLRQGRIEAWDKGYEAGLKDRWMIRDNHFDPPVQP
jgi:hypothetical protein